MFRTAVVASLLVASAAQPSFGQSSPQETQLDQTLTEARDSAQLWHWTWVALFSGGLVAQGVIAAAVDDDWEARRTTGLVAIPPVVGLTLHFINQLEALDLDDDLAALGPQLTASERLVAKRGLLQAYAKSEQLQRNWFAHVGPIFLNAAIAGLVWWTADDPVRAAIQFGVGLTLSEARVWTSPRVATNAVRDLASPPPSAARPRVMPVVGPGTAGLAIRF